MRSTPRRNGDAAAPAPGPTERLEAQKTSLLDDPWFQRWARQGERWRKAEAAVAEAVKPIAEEQQAFLDKIGGVLRGDTSDGETYRDFSRRIWETKMRVLEEHGFPVQGIPKSPAELLNRMRGLDPEVIMDCVERSGMKRPSDACEVQSKGFWSAAESMRKERPALPPLPDRPERGADRMKALKRWCEACAVDEAYGAAVELLDNLASLAASARLRRSRQGLAESDRALGFEYGMAMVAQHDLNLMVTHEVIQAARSVYSVGSPPPRIDKLPSTASLLELVRIELGIRLRNAVFAGRRTPLDPDAGEAAEKAKALQPMGWGQIAPAMLRVERFAARKKAGVTSRYDAERLFADEWKSLSPLQMDHAMRMLEFSAIDFDDLRVKLDLEARGAIGSIGNTAGTQRPTAESIEPTDHRPAAWFVGVVKAYRKSKTVELKASELRRAALGKRIVGTQTRANGTWTYSVASVLADPMLAAYAPLINDALEDGFAPKYRDRSKKQ
ncbi:MAG: hypothetical protein KF768_13730 [Phycisphaeraceae bacterium]|nr:hypothetical protein [Phycisphaeraceae bacterium]